MIEAVWAYVVKEEARTRFELAFGPGGVWSQGVARAEGFRGTTLLCDTRNPSRFLVIDLWDSEAQWIHTKPAHDTLRARLEEWVESATEVGVFRIRSQGTVRPLGTPRKRQGRGAAG